MSMTLIPLKKKRKRKKKRYNTVFELIGRENMPYKKYLQLGIFIFFLIIIIIIFCNWGISPPTIEEF